MFWIGMIVGVIIMIVAYAAVFFGVIHKYFNSTDEYWDACGLLYDATQNRECDLVLMKDEEVLDEMTFEEK